MHTLLFHPPLPLSLSSLPPSTCLRASATKRTRPNYAPTLHNRLVRHRYDILSTYECGIELRGTEVKSIRAGKLNIREGFARVKQTQLFLHNVHIAPCAYAGGRFDHEPLRVRRLLLHRSDIRKLEQKQKEGGLTLVPTKAYFSDRGYCKIEIALARGKKDHDKRADIKKRDDERELRRVVKNSVLRL